MFLQLWLELPFNTEIYPQVLYSLLSPHPPPLYVHFMRLSFVSVNMRARAPMWANICTVNLDKDTVNNLLFVVLFLAFSPLHMCWGIYLSSIFYFKKISSNISLYILSIFYFFLKNKQSQFEGEVQKYWEFKLKFLKFTDSSATYTEKK